MQRPVLSTHEALRARARGRHEADCPTRRLPGAAIKSHRSPLTASAMSSQRSRRATRTRRPALSGAYRRSRSAFGLQMKLPAIILTRAAMVSRRKAARSVFRNVGSRRLRRFGQTRFGHRAIGWSREKRSTLLVFRSDRRASVRRRREPFVYGEAACGIEPVPGAGRAPTRSV